MKKLLFALLACLAAANAGAGIDPDTDSMGIYFDTAGNVICQNVAPFTPINVYLLLMNPSAPVCGFECTVRIVGAPYFAIPVALSPSCLDVDADPWGFAIGCTLPYSITGDHVLLYSWQIMVQSTAPLYFYLGNPTFIPEDWTWPVVGSCDGTFRQCGVTSGNPNLPVASLNAGCGIIGAETSTFGTLKGLFR